jgi:hypothetical protein
MNVEPDILISKRKIEKRVAAQPSIGRGSRGSPLLGRVSHVRPEVLAANP